MMFMNILTASQWAMWILENVNSAKGLPLLMDLDIKLIMDGFPSGFSIHILKVAQNFNALFISKTHLSSKVDLVE